MQRYLTHTTARPVFNPQEWRIDLDIATITDSYNKKDERELKQIMRPHKCVLLIDQTPQIWQAWNDCIMAKKVRDQLIANKKYWAKHDPPLGLPPITDADIAAAERYAMDADWDLLQLRSAARGCDSGSWFDPSITKENCIPDWDGKEGMCDD